MASTSGSGDMTEKVIYMPTLPGEKNLSIELLWMIRERHYHTTRWIKKPFFMRFCLLPSHCSVVVSFSSTTCVRVCGGLHVEVWLSGLKLIVNHKLGKSGSKCVSSSTVQCICFSIIYSATWRSRKLVCTRWYAVFLREFLEIRGFFCAVFFTRYKEPRKKPQCTN